MKTLIIALLVSMAIVPRVVAPNINWTPQMLESIKMAKVELRKHRTQVLIDSVKLNFPHLYKLLLLESGKYDRKLKRKVIDFNSINQINMLGGWQTNWKYLKHYGYGHVTPKAFKKDPSIFPPEAQLEVVIAQHRDYDSTMKRIGIYKYLGQVIGGIKITKSRLLVAAHLAGPGGVKRWLTSNGSDNAKDINQTSVYHYLKV